MTHAPLVTPSYLAFPRHCEGGQRSVAGAAFGEPAGPSAWKRLPSWFAVATADEIVGTEAERFIAARAGSVTVEVESSHALILSQPDATADLILSAIKTID